jgi:Protein of unknown function (DUF3800)
MFTGFFDDSGKQSQVNNRFVTIAGYVGRPEWWSDLASHWQELLIYHDLPDFHLNVLMSEDFAKKRGWDWPERNAVIRDFITLVSKHRLTGFGVGVDADVWRGLSEDRRKRFGDAQLFAASRIMRLVVDRLQKTHAEEDIEICFDHDVEFSPRRLNVFDTIKKHSRSAERYVAISFADAERVIPLQVADLLAGETRTHLLRRHKGKDITPRYRQLMDAFEEEDLAYTGEFWDAKTTEEEFLKIDALLENDNRNPR